MSLNLTAIYKTKTPFKWNNITLFDVDELTGIASFMDGNNDLVEISMTDIHRLVVEYE